MLQIYFKITSAPLYYHAQTDSSGSFIQKRHILVLTKRGRNIHGSRGGMRKEGGGGEGGRQSSQLFLNSQKICCSLHYQHNFGVWHQLPTQEKPETKVIEMSRLLQSCKHLLLAVEYFRTFSLCPTRAQVIFPSNILVGLELYE